ncbi:hypothetical protein WS67_11285 [Burkholderia singularis]|uniref:Uncharacterized protein n=1 Tax=Burkholderia singularis TaxID=1503053 RepID=A0A118DP67_9BURK|nr:hypothetical protein [Burkholderia singularis]KVE27594.1 hypothetical protein WS67_11285 [Burkholderia singularis]
MCVQTFLPEAPVEAFNLGVVGRRVWPVEIQFNAMFIRPALARRLHVWTADLSAFYEPQRRHADEKSAGGRSSLLFRSALLWITDYLGKLSGVELTEPERHAAFQLLCTLPDSACVKDFVAAASAAKVKQVGLPESVALPSGVACRAARTAFVERRIVVTVRVAD